MGGKAEKGTPKYIANKIKAKGLQKLRWYCQMCQKQCRDENGFKCHTMSESHQRQLLLFADNANKYIDEFSKEFADGYLELLHRQFGTKRVNANKVYQEYISHRDHLHMNATQWETLTEFVKWLGREGKCVVDETEKGWFVAYIDRDPAAIAALESKAKKEKMDKDDQERMLDFIQKQVERGKKQSSEEGEPSYSEFKRESSQEKVVLSLKRKAEDKKSEPLPVSALKIKLKEDSSKKQKIVEDSKSKQSALDDIMKMQERAKEKANSYFGKNTMSESQQQARKRGANYTQEERCLLLDLIAQFKDIVECKNTGGWFLKKKRAAWHAITIKYNNNCSSGKRKTDQLKSLYDNMKQKSRKTGKGESNKVVYIDTEHEDRMETEDDPACASKIDKDDEIEMIRTGDGFWKPKLSNNDAKVLAIIQDQVDPLHNPYDSDSASSFFKETVTQDNDDINIKPDNASSSCSPTEMMTEKAEKYQDSEPIIEEVYESPIPKIKKRCGKIIKREKAPRQKKIVKYTSAEALKRLYFKKKCQNVDLERKKLMLEILYQKREHVLRLKILKNKLDNVNVDIGET